MSSPGEHVCLHFCRNSQCRRARSAAAQHLSSCGLHTITGGAYACLCGILAADLALVYGSKFETDVVWRWSVVLLLAGVLLRIQCCTKAKLRSYFGKVDARPPMNLLERLAGITEMSIVAAVTVAVAPLAVAVAYRGGGERLGDVLVVAVPSALIYGFLAIAQLGAVFAFELHRFDCAELLLKMVDRSIALSIAALVFPLAAVVVHFGDIQRHGGHCWVALPLVLFYGIVAAAQLGSLLAFKRRVRSYGAGRFTTHLLEEPGAEDFDEERPEHPWEVVGPRSPEAVPAILDIPAREEDQENDGVDAEAEDPDPEIGEDVAQEAEEESPVILALPAYAEERDYLPAAGLDTALGDAFFTDGSSNATSTRVIALTVYVLQQGPESVTLSCTGMSGDVLAAVSVNPERAFMGHIHAELAIKLGVPVQDLRLLLPTGGVLTSRNSVPLVEALRVAT